MKNLILALVCLLSLTAHAQKRYINLQLFLRAPYNNQVVVYGDTLRVKLVLKNLGPDTLKATDSIAARIINNQAQVFTFGDTGKMKPYTGTNGVMLVPGDSMPFNYKVPTDGIFASAFFHMGDNSICFDAYPCADSINGIWPSNMDTAQMNNVECINLRLLAVSVGQVAAQSLDVQVYPNPAAGLLHLQYHTTAPGTLLITDLAGRTLISRQVDAGNTTATVPLGNLAPGIYLYRLSAGDGMASGKFGVQ